MDPQQEIILSQNIRLSNDSSQRQLNLHTVIIIKTNNTKTINTKTKKEDK